ncbi:MAG: diguanylate cyclase [Pirellulaceae bacterium]
MSDSQIDSESLLRSFPLPMGQASSGANENSNQIFLKCLLDNMPEGVVFLDQTCTIRNWNAGVQQLTGIGSAIVGRRLEPSLLKLKDCNRFPISESSNPFEKWLNQGVAASDKFYVSGRSGRDAQIEVNFFPVRSNENRPIGGIILIRDTSVQVELQRQLNDLYAIATLDPLTQVANRAEFERILNEYIQTHRAVGLRCSIVVADIDFFKKVNDNLGHHVGDQALIKFATILKQYVRPHDFIARFGGEEFVILCGHCFEDAAAQRAEEIRRALESTPHKILGDKCMTASFGVAELADDDDATSLFVRADHALLKAKTSGRNCVIRASGLMLNDHRQSQRKPVDSVCPDQWRKLNYRPTIVQEFCTPMLLTMFIERVKSTAMELNSQIIHCSERSLSLQIQATNELNPSQRGTLVVDIDVVDAAKSLFARVIPQGSKLLIRIAMHPKKGLFSSREHAGVAESLMKKLRSLLALDHQNEIKVGDGMDSDASRYAT